MQRNTRMAKLPPGKKTKSSGTTSGQLGMSKMQPTKNFKKSIKKKPPSGSSPKPTKTKGSKPQATQMKKKENKGNKPAKTKNQKKTKGRRARPDIPRKQLVLKKYFSSAAQKDKKLMKRFGQKVNKTPKAKKNVEVDPTQLISADMLEAAVSGLRKLPSVGKGEKKSLHDITDVDERLVYLQVTLCKLPKVTEDFHMAGPTAVNVYLPHSLVTDNTDVILITKDLQRGVKRDHQNSVDHFKELLHKHEATSLVNEVIPLRQLKVEYKEFEAKRLLANRTDVLLCDDTVVRFIPKFLSKHFYTKKKVPVQVNLKAEDLQKELLRALAVSKLFFTMKGNCSIMKIGRMGQTDEEIQENVLAAVKKLATHAPGEWANIQGLSLKLERTTSIPIYVKMDSLNNVKPIPARPIFPGEPVSGLLSTVPGKCVTVFPDGSVTVSKKYNRLSEEEARIVRNRPKKEGSKAGKKLENGKEKPSKAEDVVGAPEAEAEVSNTKKEAKKNSTKRKAAEEKSSKTKKQKKAQNPDSDSDSGEEDLEEEEEMYLRQLQQRREESAGNQEEEEEEEEEDVWADSDSDMDSD